jgi:hypothetical protein
MARTRSMKRSNNIKNNKGSVKKSRKSAKRGMESPSFAAKLAAFILEGLGNAKPVIGKGDNKMQSQLKGALPYLHMNITEQNVRNKFKETEQMRINGLSTLCNDKDHRLDTKLKDVKFNCKQQSTAGVMSINQSIVDSINNRWSIRHHGQRHVRTLAKMMTKQHKAGEIPASSLKWTKGLRF